MTDYIRHLRKAVAQLLKAQGLHIAALGATMLSVLYDLIPWS